MKLEALYKRSTTGKISFLQIEVEGNKFRTESGFLDGKKVISDWVECNKKTYCSAEEQALKQATALQRKKIETGMFTNMDEIDNKSFISPMLAKDYNDYKDKIEFPVYSQPKLDGVRCLINKEGMWSRTGKKIISAPHIFEDLAEIFQISPDMILDGELYSDKLSNDFNTIISCIKKTKPTKEDLAESKAKIEYHIYDIPSTKGKFSERLKIMDILAIFGSLPNPVKIIHTTTHWNQTTLDGIYFNYIENGYEGQMVRLDKDYENKRSNSLLKRKEFQTDEFPIISINEGVGKMKGKASTITIKTNEGVLVDATLNGTHEYLEKIWKEKNTIIGKQATIKYFNKTIDGSIRFPKVIDIDRFSYE